MKKYLLVSALILGMGHGAFASPKCESAAGDVFGEMLLADQLDIHDGLIMTTANADKVLADAHERHMAMRARIRGLLRANCHRGDTISFVSDYLYVTSEFCDLSKTHTTGKTTVCVMKCGCHITSCFLGFSNQ